MSIFQNNLSYSDFFNNEYKTLGFLQKNPTVAANFANLSGQAFSFYYTYKGIRRQRPSNEIGFEFNCELELVIENKNRTVIIESVVLPEFSLSSYMYAICSTSNPKTSRLLRKFHFDFAIPTLGQISKPVYHLQYGGEKIKCSPIDVEPLDPWLSSPRINCAPINLALLLDHLFCEFRERNVAIERLIEAREWRNLIKQNEDLILSPFYKSVNHFISHSHKSDFLLREYYYGR